MSNLQDLIVPKATETVQKRLESIATKLKNRSKKPTGLIIYEGISQLDNKTNIVCIATLKSNNAKTGNGIQLWILNADIDPVASVKNGTDASVCGNCKHRGESGKERTCYVNLGQAPLAIYRAYKRGSYTAFDGDYTIFTDKYVRFGAYGDPAAVPISVFLPVLDYAKKWSGYTHQWKVCNPLYLSFLMASVDDNNEALEAQLMGYRYFRIKSEGDALIDNEIYCPSDRIKCNACGLCSGIKKAAKSIAINVHGTGRKHFN